MPKRTRKPKPQTPQPPPSNAVRELAASLDILSESVRQYESARHDLVSARKAAASHPGEDAAKMRKKAYKKCLPKLTRLWERASRQIEDIRPRVDGIHRQLGALDSNPAIWETELAKALLDLEHKIGGDYCLMKLNFLATPDLFNRAQDDVYENLRRSSTRIWVKANDLRCVAVTSQEPDGKGATMKVPWDDKAPGFVQLTRAVRAVDNVLTVTRLGQWLREPSCAVHYMTKGRTTKACLSELMLAAEARYGKTGKADDDEDDDEGPPSPAPEKELAEELSMEDRSRAARNGSRWKNAAS